MDRVTLLNVHCRVRTRTGKSAVGFGPMPLGNMWSFRASKEWIPYNGSTAFKIKLNGDDLAWDVECVAAIERVAARAEAKRHFSEWIYSLDFNERCPNVQYVLDFERQLQGKAPSAFRRVQYIERPTARDPTATPVITPCSFPSSGA